ncbi:type 1 glutamine amidotransferase [Mucilaginibacter jinjuensis]|uniref:GMP synthase n=1 Tax=Mucilaginibacter jinjuensis TaxID=1176721 RepID=A0ABY7T8I2_9SPHI|nr:GMP synthase [Mucilaginibacter jinjuensis]WCT12794.1 GMP synthase [Mucilaginibacter jinjuensis]
MPATRQIKIAILDLYNGIANQAINSFEQILEKYRTKHKLNLNWQIFKVREANELPDLNFDAYLSSGGPGNPFSGAEEWDKNYFKLIDGIEAYNNSNQKPKKHVLFICHSFQLLCRRYKLGEVLLRNIPSFGIVPVELLEDDDLLKNLSNPFYAVDSRSWQVVNPDMKVFEKIGAKILAIERERSDHLPRALMAIRLNDYFVATQFHPEMSPEIMGKRLLMDDNKQQVIDEFGEEGYQQMLEELNDADKLWLTFNTIMSNFLDRAILS